MLKVPSTADRLHMVMTQHFDGIDRTAWPVSITRSVGDIRRLMGNSLPKSIDLRAAVIDHLVRRGLNVLFDEGDPLALRIVLYDRQALH